MSKTLDVVLLLALPASGKSEVRKFLDWLPEKRLREEFHIGRTLQLDDYPYVHFMHVIDDLLAQCGQDFVFYRGPDRPFQDGREWQTLVELLNEDFDDLIHGRTHAPVSAAQLLFDRLDAAREKAGFPDRLGQLPYRVRCDMAASMESDCRTDLEARNAQCRQSVEGRTIFIEMARGGPNGAAFPLTPPQGYEFALSKLSGDILDRAGILYVWVTPEDSRRKNIERGIPGEQASILHHSVPMEVMLGEYGCDDMEYLVRQSDVPDTVKSWRIVTVPGPDGTSRYSVKTWHLPVARFDNRADLTSFIRDKEWNPADVARMEAELKRALGLLTAR
jgi:hypothetical protein